jgi:hypothetical protein
VNFKISLTSLLIIAIIATATFAVSYGLLTWTGVVTWTTESKQFTVWDAATGGTSISTPFTDSLPPIIPNDQYVYDFYLQNDGNIPLTVTVTGTPVGCTVSWNNPSWTIPVGTTRVHAELTLTLTAAGSYSWQFQISS